MTGAPEAPHWGHGWWLTAGILVVFAALQIATLDYGTRVNDLPYIRDYRITSDVMRDSGLNREQLVGGAAERQESLDLGMLRFKLYSVEADEVVNIIALARIKPGQLQFDPKFYQYGGAFLYPLGAWYLALSKLGVVEVTPLDQMLARPQQMDRIWIAGRAFVLIAFLASAVLLALALREIAPPPFVAAALAIYLFCPASVMFSQVMKPHWYALFWVNTALLILVRAFLRNRLTLCAELLLGATIGLAVGSATTFALMAVLLWGALVVLMRRAGLSFAMLVRVPAVALIAFVATNPYYVLNWQAVRNEQAAAASWFHWSLDPSVPWQFVQNSAFAGFGLVFTLLMFTAIVYCLVRGPAGLRLFALAIAAPILFIAAMTASLATWNSNVRYIPYIIPAALILIALTRWPKRSLILGLCAVATVAQAMPMKLAYFDENSNVHGTRLVAAEWINANVPNNAGVCLATKTLVPFDVPPFRFDQYRINAPDCTRLVRVERNPRAVTVDPGYTIEKRFTPRLSPQAFPLVWEHINPQITVYRKQ